MDDTWTGILFVAFVLVVGLLALSLVDALTRR